jgi:uncharacterized membrane protein
MKARAKEILQGNWGTAIAVMLVTAVITGLGSRLGPSYYQTELGAGIHMEERLNLVQTVVGGALSVGTCGVYLSFLRQGKSDFIRLFDGFTDCFVAALIAYLIVTIATAVGCVLLLVPGIIVALMFSQTFFILRDHPDMSGLDAAMASKDMMKGHKAELFVLWLSFLPWFLLCVLVLPLLYVGPYCQATLTVYYEQLRQESGF